VSDLDGELLDGGGDDGQRGEVFGVAVALQHLRGAGSRLQPRLLADVLLDLRIDVGEGADRAGDLAVGDGLQSRLHALEVPGHLVVPKGHLQAEGDRLGVDAVRAPHLRGHLVLEGAGLDDGHQALDVGDDQLARFLEEHGEGGVQDVGGGKPQVDEAGVVADVVGDRGEEGDDVVFHGALDLVDARHVEARLGPDARHRVLGDAPHLGVRLAGVDLYLEPLAVAVLGLPDAGHFRTAVTFNHEFFPLGTAD